MMIVPSKEDWLEKGLMCRMDDEEGEGMFVYVYCFTDQTVWRV
ncbi:MAG: hypothetical protein R3F17_16785 [Planctomycetota bacterium]